MKTHQEIMKEIAAKGGLSNLRNLSLDELEALYRLYQQALALLNLGPLAEYQKYYSATMSALKTINDAYSKLHGSGVSLADIIKCKQQEK